MEKEYVCSVCWTCRGLLTEKNLPKSEIERHKKFCNAANNPQLTGHEVDYFVCDKLDYIALVELKQSLTQEAKDMLFNETALRDFIPVSIITSLLNLCVTDKASPSPKVQILNFGQPETHSFNDKRNMPDEYMNQILVSSSDSHIGNPNVGTSFSLGENNLLTEAERNKLEKESHIELNGTGTVHELVCQLCQYKSKSSKIMLRHLCSHNNGQPFQCTLCNFSTLYRSQWNRHHCKHRERSYDCNSCPAQFSAKTKLLQHISSVHAANNSLVNQRFVCETCSYVGRDLAALKEHQRKHTGETLLCSHPNCNFKTMYKRSLLKHQQQKHSEGKSQICDVCGFQTRYAASLKKHLLLHTSFKPYKCTECSFASFSPSEILHHVERKHLKQKKYSCPKCSFQSGYALAMKKHIVRHDRPNALTSSKVGDKPKKNQHYSCSECGVVLKSVKRVKEHIRDCHKDDRVEFVSTETDDELTLKATAERESTALQAEGYDATKVMNFESLLDVDISDDGLDITSNILNSVGSRQDFQSGDEPQTVVRQGPLAQPVFTEGQQSSTSVGNPMLSATSDVLADAENSLIEDSVFDLMSDLPRPPNLYRCQSASTLMFASLSPHLVDRPLTPDIFSDSPASSFFQNFHPRNLDSDSLVASSFPSVSGQSSQNTHMPSSFTSSLDAATLALSRNIKAPSPIPPSFTCFSSQANSQGCQALSSSSLDVVSGMSDCLL